MWLFSPYHTLRRLRLQLPLGDRASNNAWMLSFGFPPISSPSAELLILGSLPGRLSLERGEYYANPQNAFWRILAVRLPQLPADYAGRVRVLIERRLALWDVLAAATRSGSLDADIADDAISNNFRAFFHAHPHIRLIGFNGATAAKLYERHVMPTLSDEQRGIALETLPSTSGAHAGVAFTQKVERWSILFDAATEVAPGAPAARAFKPNGWPTVIPRIIVRDPENLITFVKRAFGAEGGNHPGRPAEMWIGDSLLLVSDGGGLRDAMPAFLYVYVEDVDAIYARALAEGASSVEAPAQMTYGDRRATIQDPWGNTWQVAMHRAVQYRS
ncbi:MAG: DNA-deoxyinosine glycosylase [Steroidobacteraceae bacterium]